MVQVVIQVYAMVQVRVVKLYVYCRLSILGSVAANYADIVPTHVPTNTEHIENLCPKG